MKKIQLDQLRDRVLTGVQDDLLREDLVGALADLERFVSEEEARKKNPVLRCIAAFLASREHPTVDLLAKETHVSKLQIAEIIAANRSLIEFDHRGRIAALNVEKPTITAAYDSGKVYFVKPTEDEAALHDAVLDFSEKAQPDLYRLLAQQIQRPLFGGRIVTVKRIYDTIENREALRKAGLKNGSRIHNWIKSEFSLWKE